MTEEEIKRAINNPPYKIAIDNLYKCALEFCKAAKRYLENTDRSKQDELAQISRSKWALFCSSVDSLSHWPNKDCEEELRKELRMIAFPISLQIFYSTENQRGFKKRGDSPTTIPQQFQLL